MTSNDLKKTKMCINQGVSCTRLIESKLMILILIFISITIFSFFKCNVIYLNGKLGFNEMTSLLSNPLRDPYRQCTPQRF